MPEVSWAELIYIKRYIVRKVKKYEFIIFDL